jgi:hypothetical protein
MLFPNWQAFLTSRPTNEAGNKNSAIFTTAWSVLTTNDAKLTTISNDNTLAVVAIDRDNKVVIMHSFKNLGGTLLHPTNKFACLIGSGHVTSVIIVDKASLLLPLDIAAPTYATIISCLDEQEISAIAYPAQANNDPNNFRCSASFLLAPWVLEAILETKSNNPATLLLATNNAANNFNHAHKNNPDFITNAEEQHAQITKWLWAVQAGHIPRTNYSVEPNNDNLLDYSDLRHSQHILPCNIHFGAPPTPAGAPPAFPAAVAAQLAGNNSAGATPNGLDILQVSILCQVDVLDRMNMNAKETFIFHREKEMKKKDHFVKFHPSSKQMILFASASDPFSTPIEPKETCKRFINTTTHGVAEQELSMQLKGLRLSEMAFTTGLTLNL